MRVGDCGVTPSNDWTHEFNDRIVYRAHIYWEVIQWFPKAGSGTIRRYHLYKLTSDNVVQTLKHFIKPPIIFLIVQVICTIKVNLVYKISLLDYKSEFQKKSEKVINCYC